MQAGEPLERARASTPTQHFTEPPPRYSEASWSSAWRSSASAGPRPTPSILAVLRDREYVRIDKKRLVPEDKGRLVTAFLESFFRRYVEYDFTADLEEKLDRVSNSEIDWKEVLRDFWTRLLGRHRRHQGAAHDARCSTRSTSCSARTSSPTRATASNPRACPTCGTGQLSLKLGKFGAFIGCSNYPECKLHPPARRAGAERRRRGRPDGGGRARRCWATIPRPASR